MSKILKWFAPLLFVSMLSACASSQVEHNLDAKLAATPPVKGRSELRAEVEAMIRSAPDLTPEQRKRLAILEDSAQKQSELLREEVLRLRAVLIQDVLAKNYSEADVNAVKNKLTETEEARLHLFFLTVNNANTILGRWGSKRERQDDQFYHEMMLDMMNVYYP